MSFGFYILSPFAMQIGGLPTRLLPGAHVNDPQIIVALQNAGAIMWPDDDPDVIRAAARALIAKQRGASEDELSRIMQGTVTSRGRESPHAMISLLLTAAPDGMGGTLYTSTTTKAFRCTPGAPIDNNKYVAIPLGLDEPLDNDQQASFLTLHVDPNAGIGPFQPFSLNSGIATDIAIPIDTGQLPVMSSTTIEVHYVVNKFPE